MTTKTDKYRRQKTTMIRAIQLEEGPLAPSPEWRSKVIAKIIDLQRDFAADMTRRNELKSTALADKR